MYWTTVEVGESTWTILQQAFIPQKNADWLMLRHQFMVLKFSTMAPKVDEVIDAKCQMGVKSTDTVLTNLQLYWYYQIQIFFCVLYCTNVWGPLTKPEKMAACVESSKNTMVLLVVEDAQIRSPAALLDSNSILSA